VATAAAEFAGVVAVGAKDQAVAAAKQTPSQGPCEPLRIIHENGIAVGANSGRLSHRNWRIDGSGQCGVEGQQMCCFSGALSAHELDCRGTLTGICRRRLVKEVDGFGEVDVSEGLCIRRGECSEGISAEIQMSEGQLHMEVPGNGVDLLAGGGAERAKVGW
jgi:hypothetical protein